MPFSPGLLTHDTHPGDQQWSRLPPGARLRAQLSDFQYLTRERRKEERQGPRYHGEAQTLHFGMQIPSPCSTEGLIPLLWERSRNINLASFSFFFSNQASPGIGCGQSLDLTLRDFPLKPVPRNYTHEFTIMEESGSLEQEGADHRIGYG